MPRELGRFGGIVGACGLALLVLTFHVGPETAAAARVAGHGTAMVVADSWGPPRVLIGATTPPGPRDLRSLDAFERAARHRVDIYGFYEDWASTGFDETGMKSISRHGSLPMVTWEPWDHRRGVDQPRYSLRRIARGAFDTRIRRWAAAAKRHQGRILLRFAHEMNASNYPWCEGVNGNGPGSYVRAWRHVHDIFARVGADNVRWVWAPNVAYPGTTPFARLYPGKAYVDWLGLDGYNGGTALPWGGWLSFRQIFGPSIRAVRAIAPHKPIMISEMASAERGGSKATWIRNFFRSLREHPRVRAFVWFNWKKEADWRIQSSTGSRRAFAAGIDHLRS